MEKVGTIVSRHIEAYPIETIYVVGGTASFAGIGPVIAEITGVETHIPTAPLFVTPFGVAMYDK